MHELFFERIRASIPLSSEQEGIIRKYLRAKKLRKRQYLLQEGDVSDVVALVEKGALRAYTIDEKGVEHVLRFALEGAFIGDLSSFLNGRPSTYHIDALEDSELLLVSRSAYDEICLRIPEFNSFTLAEMTAIYLMMQERINAILSLSVEERYSKFQMSFPDLVQRIPQHMIASYMGLTPETVSRIRGRIREK